MFREWISDIEVGKFLFQFKWVDSDVRIALFYDGELVADCLAYHSRVEAFYNYILKTKSEWTTLAMYIELMTRLGEPVMDYTYFRVNKKKET